MGNWFRYQVASSWIAIDELESVSKLSDQYRDALCELAVQKGYSVPLELDLLYLYVTITPPKRLTIGLLTNILVY